MVVLVINKPIIQYKYVKEILPRGNELLQQPLTIELVALMNTLKLGDIIELDTIQLEKDFLLKHKYKQGTAHMIVHTYFKSACRKALGLYICRIRKTRIFIKKVK